MFHFSGSRHVNFAKIYTSIEGLVEELPVVKKRREKGLVLKLFKGVVSAFFLLVGLVLAVFAFQAMTVKAIYADLRSGQSGLEYALALSRDKYFAQARESAQVAEDDFRAADEGLKRIGANPMFAALPVLAAPVKDAGRLAGAAMALARAVGQSASLGEAYYATAGEGHTFTSLPGARKAAVLKLLYESGPEIKAINGELAAALDSLQGISPHGVFWPVSGKIAQLKAEIGAYSGKLKQAEPAARLLPRLLGYPEKSAFLFLLQNQDELRPTGGFIGTYGLLETKDGEILRFDTHDVYHMDMPVKDLVNVAPPPALKEYLGVDKWFMRDANWSPDWPTAAKKTEEFFYLEDKLLPPKDQINRFNGTFDGVIGVTPVAVTDMMALTGPVTIEGVEYNQGNFTDLLQYRVERGYEQLGVSSWQRKEVIGQILSEMKKVLLNRPLTEVLAALDTVYGNFERKDILVHWREDDLNALSAANNWNGALRQAEGDYLYVVDANMAAYKTDAVISRKIEYTVNGGEDRMVAKLKVFYSHRGGFDWKTTRYRTYVRVYAPQGSRLVSSKGYADDKAKSYDELGRTVFAGFVSVEPGEIGQLELEYELPMAIVDTVRAGEYRLLVQRQPGTRVDGLNVALGFDRPVAAFEPTGFFAQKAGDSQVYWEDDLDRDKSYKVRF